MSSECSFPIHFNKYMSLCWPIDQSASAESGVWCWCVTRWEAEPLQQPVSGHCFGAALQQYIRLGCLLTVHSSLRLQETNPMVDAAFPFETPLTLLRDVGA